VCLIITTTIIPSREKSIIESTNRLNHATIVAIMSKTIRKYQTRDRRNQYKRIEKLKLEDRYYTDVAKSHERKIEKRGLSPDDGGQEQSR
jgi:hypothetical protein